MAITFDRINKFIFITAPQTIVTIQNLIDAIRDYEDEDSSMDLTSLANCSGKASLGGGSYVGLTLELLDGWKIKFEDRIGPAYTTCYVTGGNLAQVGVTYPIEPSAFTFVIVTSSASATIASLEIANLQRIIESQRPSHTATGNIWYWDPYGGDDGNDGTSPTTPVQTFAQAQILAQSGNSDMIFCQATDPLGIATATENLVITKDRLFIRGPGRSFKIEPASDASPVITITGLGVEVSSLVVAGAATGNEDIISIGNDCVLLQDLWLENSRGNGIYISDSAQSKFERLFITNAVEDGLFIDNNCNDLFIDDCIIENCDCGICINGNASNISIRGSKTDIHGNSTYGVYIAATASNILLTTDCTIQNNTIKDVLDIGQETHYSGVSSISYNGEVYLDAAGSTTGTQYPRGTVSMPVNNLLDAYAIALRNNIHAFKLSGLIVLDRTYNGYTFEGIGNIASNIIVLAGQDINASNFKNVVLTGNGSGWVSISDGYLVDVIGISVTAIGSGITTAFTMTGDNTVAQCINCAMASFPAIVDFGSTNNSAFQFGGIGDITVLNMTPSCLLVTATTSGSHITLDSSCTGGIALIGGMARIIDNSGGAMTIIDDTVTGMLTQEHGTGSWTGNISTLNTINSNVNTIKSNTNTIKTDVSFIKKVESGRWQILNDQMIFYDTDGITPLMTFDLKDIDGVPTSVNVFERVPA